jgi:hypothetical protein
MKKMTTAAAAADDDSDDFINTKETQLQWLFATMTD